MDDFGQIFKVQNTDGYGGQILLKLLPLVRCYRLEAWYHQHQIIWCSLILQNRVTRILSMNL